MLKNKSPYKMKKFTILLSLLLCIIFTSQSQIAVKSFTHLENDLDASTYFPKKDLNNKQCAIIKIFTTQMGFSFDNGSLGIVATEQKTAEIWVYVPEGTMKLKLAHQQLGHISNGEEDGYYWFPIGRVKAGQCYKMELVTGTVKTIVEEAKVQTGWLIIKSSPTEAEVYITEDGVDKYKGTTPFQGKMAYGTYHYRLKKSKYHTEAGVAQVDKTKVELDIKLLPAFGTLSITSIPAGAKVIIDGTDSGKTTPCTVSEVASGTHEIRLLMDNYAPSTKNVTVVDGQTSNVNVTLDAQFATITINSLPNATIKVNGVVVGTGSYTANLSEGFYDIEASLASHRAATKQIEVTAKQSQTIDLKPTPIYGSMDVMTEPMDATISINGKTFGTTPNTIENLLVGDYDVVLTLSGYETVTKRVSVAEKATASVNITMQKVVPKKKTSQEISTNVTKNTSKNKKNSYSTGASGLKYKLSSSLGMKETAILESLIVNMVYVEGGTFMMGATSEQGSDADSDEKPVHQVTVSDFYISKYELTQDVYEVIMGKNPVYNHMKDPQKPATMMNWDDVQEFLSKLNRLTGLEFSLPTGAEWEYAARGGKYSKGYKYCGSNNVKDVAWYKGNSSDDTHKVGLKKANELGLYDMSGNVDEMCSDWKGSYTSSSKVNPQGPTTGEYRLCRGGYYNEEAADCRVSARSVQKPDARYCTTGIRLVVRAGNTSNNYSNRSNTGGTYSQNANSSTMTVAQKTVIEELYENMLEVQGGTFSMGGTSEQGNDAEYDETPVHQVTLSNFYICKYEVTQKLWEAVMGNNPSKIDKGPNKPVTYVSWEDCQEFIKKLNSLTGFNFRLPTEAEWEYAARGGKYSKGYKYSGSNRAKDVAWYKANSNGDVQDVGLKRPNELGLYDMSGNVSEWVYDWKDVYSSEKQYNPQGPTSGEWKVYRGGDHYDDDVKDLRVSSRAPAKIDNGNSLRGFRLALTYND